METNRAIFVGLAVMLLFVVGGTLGDSKKINSENTGSDSQLNNTNGAKEQAIGSHIGSKSTEVSEENKEKVDLVSKLKEQVIDDVNSNNSTTKNGSTETSKTEKDDKETDNKQRGDSSSAELQVKEDNHKDEKESSSGSSKPKVIPREKSSGGDSQDPATLQNKEGNGAEECDTSNKCADKENKLVACLRVPGNESPDLSLLIQNKGKNPLSVTIAAPNFVQLEKTKIQLQENENKRVKVSITKRGQENLIVLRAGNGCCELDIRDLISRNFGEEFDNSHRSTYLDFGARTPYIAVLCFAVLMTLVSGWMCCSLRQKQHSKDGSNYQRIDMELPIFKGGKMESDVNDGWDNSWGDDWDEEAPKTPSMPVTPSLSSKGLASRRLSKDGWKD